MATEDSNTKIIQKPIIISTENLEMATFLITYGSNNAIQFWTLIAGGHEYTIQYSTSTSTFNSPENTEILDHFIK